jgi:hypothetical protein
LSATGTDIPVVETLPATGVGQTIATINGALLYDGNLGCYVGFRWRQQGAGTWNTNELSRQLHSIQNFQGQLSGLTLDTSYEYQAYAKNDLAHNGIFGNVTTFTTLHAAGITPTATPSGGSIIPPLPPIFHVSLPAGVKLIIALIVTILGMLAVGVFMAGKGASSSSGYVILAYGFAAIIGFAIFGWYPTYVLYLIGGIVGLGILLTLAGRTGGKPA